MLNSCLKFYGISGWCCLLSVAYNKKACKNNILMFSFHFGCDVIEVNNFYIFIFSRIQFNIKEDFSETDFFSDQIRTDPLIKASRSSQRRYSMKYVFFKISQNSQENTCVGVFIKKETPTQVISLRIAKFLRTSILKNTSGRLILSLANLFTYLTLYCIMLKNGQTHFKNLAVFTPQDF